LIDSVSSGQQNSLVLCVCAATIILETAGYLVYKYKFKLDEDTYAEIQQTLKTRGENSQQS